MSNKDRHATKSTNSHQNCTAKFTNPNFWKLVEYFEFATYNSNFIEIWCSISSQGLEQGQLLEAENVIISLHFVECIIKILIEPFAAWPEIMWSRHQINVSQPFSWKGTFISDVKQIRKFKSLISIFLFSKKGTVHKLGNAKRRGKGLAMVLHQGERNTVKCW
jgi:hypothetical protein